MNTSQLILEYCRVAFSMPVVVLVVSLVCILMFKKEIRGLFSRVGSLKIGAFEATASQSKMINQVKDSTLPSQISIESSNATASIVNETDGASKDASPELIAAEKARAVFWEYRFLDFFLVLNTQKVFDWFLNLNERATLPLYDAIWSQSIPDPNERMAIIGALKSHHLIQLVDGLFEVTPKGKEYAGIRNPPFQWK